MKLTNDKSLRVSGIYDLFLSLLLAVGVFAQSEVVSSCRPMIKGRLG